MTDGRAAASPILPEAPRHAPVLPSDVPPSDPAAASRPSPTQAAPDGRPAHASGAVPAAPHSLHHPLILGAERQGDGSWRFALWAPAARSVELDLDGARIPMVRETGGVWRVEHPAAAGAPYAFVVDGLPTPDPLARAQAGMDVMGPSRLVDPRAHAWTTRWEGRPWEEAVLYELHVGTFTEEGTFAAAARRLPDLAALGVTGIEVMPVPHGPGARGWGYDGALLLAPHPAYGTPDDLRAFVEEAQRHGILVLMDLVLNHVAPEGSDLHRICPAFFDPSESSPWGAAIAYGTPLVRRTMTDLCLAWIAEYRLDGLRLDAVHEIRDPGSRTHFVVELARTIRGLDWGRPIHLVTEDSRNRPTLREPDPETGRPLYTAEWNDDFHHAMHCLLTDEAHGYLASFAEDPLGDVVRALAQGYAHEGDGVAPHPEGVPAGDLPWTAFVNHNQNHDQVGNHPAGRRLIHIAAPGALEVAQGLLLLGPAIPLLFMGEEEGERAPFHYFCDVPEDLGRAIHEGRREEFGSDEPGGRDFPDPNALATFVASRPFQASGSEHAARWRELTARFLAARHAHVVPLLRSGRAGPARVRATGARALRAEWPFAAGTLRIAANLGAPPDSRPGSAGGEPAPLLAWGDLARDAYALSLTVSPP